MIRSKLCFLSAQRYKTTQSPAGGDIPGYTTQPVARLTQSLPPAAASHRHPQQPAPALPGQTHTLRTPGASLRREMGQTGGRGGCSPPAGASLGGWMRPLPSPPASLVQLQPPLCLPSGCRRGKAAADWQPWLAPDLPPSTSASERHRAAKTFGGSAPAAVVLRNSEDHRQPFTRGGWRHSDPAPINTPGGCSSRSLFAFLLLVFFFFLTDKIHLGDCLL